MTATNWNDVYPNHVLEGTCPRCNHTFTVKRKETRDRAEEIGGGVIASCPECTHDTYPTPKAAEHAHAPARGSHALADVETPATAPVPAPVTSAPPAAAAAPEQPAAPKPPRRRGE